MAHPLLVVKRSSIHNRGVFARRQIPKGTRVIEYVGEKITKAESERRADRQLGRAKQDAAAGAVYIFELNKRYDIDGNVAYNLARLINHSCDPNCETGIVRGHIWISAIRDIAKGEELSYNYGYDMDNYEDHPCRCGSRNCQGYIVAEEERGKLKRARAKKKQEKRR